MVRVPHTCGAMPGPEWGETLVNLVNLVMQLETLGFGAQSIVLGAKLRIFCLLFRSCFISVY